MTKTCSADDFEQGQCECFPEAGWMVVTLGIAMVVGNLILFAQMEKIRRRGTTVGVSGWMVALHCAFNTFAGVNYVALSYYQLIPCCQHGSTWYCFGTLLPAISQVEVIVIVHIIFATFALYHEPDAELSMSKLRRIAACTLTLEVVAIAAWVILAQVLPQPQLSRRSLSALPLPVLCISVPPHLC